MTRAWSENSFLPVIILASEKRVTISWLTRILSNLQAILLRPNFLLDYVKESPSHFGSTKARASMVSLNSMMNRVAEKHFLKVTKRRKLTDSRTHSPSETFTTLDLSPGTYDRFRIGRAFVSAAFAFSPSYQQPAGGTTALQETNGSQLFSRFSRRCAADWVQDTTIVRIVCYQVNGGLWLEPITN